jgi:hypothetical protein
LRAAPEITIEHETALIAAECPFGQAQFGFHHATGRTGLGGRVPAVRDVHGGGGPPGFVLDLASEFAPADPGDAPGEAPVAEHPSDVEVFDHYRAVLADEPGGQLVQAVPACVGHGGVQAGDAGLGRAPPLRGHLSCALVGADTAGGLALQATQLREGDLQVARVGG